MTRLEFLEKARSVHGYKYLYPSIGEKIRLTDRVEVSYGGRKYEQSVAKHLMGRCPEKAESRKTTGQFVEEAREIWGDKYDYSRTEYVNALVPVLILHRGIEYWQRPSSHLEGMAPEFRKNEESALRDLLDRSDSEGELEIEGFLRKFNIGYSKDCLLGGIEFDFYLPSLRVCIEFDGIYHFQPVEELGGLNAYEKAKIDEKKKSDYCEDNYIELVRIRYDQIDNIYMILWSSLKNKI